MDIPQFFPRGCCVPGTRGGVRPDENPPSIVEGDERRATVFHRRGRDVRVGRDDLFGHARKERESAQIFLLSGDCASRLPAQGKHPGHHRDDVGKFPVLAAGRVGAQPVRSDGVGLCCGGGAVLRSRSSGPDSSRVQRLLDGSRDCCDFLRVSLLHRSSHCRTTPRRCSSWRHVSTLSPTPCPSRQSSP